MYNGIKTLELSDQELADFYDGKLNIDLLTNQYLLVSYNNNVVEKYRFDGNKLLRVRNVIFDTIKPSEKIKAKNTNQELYMDLLSDKTIPVKAALGIAGSGKTFLATAYAIQELLNKRYEKLVIVRNPIQARGVPQIGNLPGDATQKLLNSCMFLSDILGEKELANYLNMHQIELCYLGDMRSRSIKNSIILCNESQNLSKDLIKMIITRVGEGSQLLLDFDLSQIDSKSFELDNGMLAMIEGLKGDPLFGIIELNKVERSEVAKLVEKIK